MAEPTEYTFRQYLEVLLLKASKSLVRSWQLWVLAISFGLFIIGQFNKPFADFLFEYLKGMPPWVFLGPIIVLFLWNIAEAIYDDRNNLYLNYAAMKERALKAEEKLTTKIITSLLDCSLSDGYLYIKLSLCNDGYKSWTIELFNIITANRDHLLRIQYSNGLLDNNYNNILNINCISDISKEPVQCSLTYKPADIDEIEIKEPFKLKDYLRQNNVENIKKMPLGIIMRLRDYKGLQHFVDYYACCEIYIREDGGISTQIIHKPFERILKEGETNIAKSWHVCPKREGKDMPEPGDINRNGQMLIRRTTQPGNHPNARIWILRCTKDNCNHEYGANGCDFHERKCPLHQGGKPGLPID